MIGLSLVPGLVWPVARCSVGLGPRHGPKSLTASTPPNEPSLTPSPLSGTRSPEAAEIVQPAYREIAGSTRNPSQITCSMRCHLPPAALEAVRQVAVEPAPRLAHPRPGGAGSQRLRRFAS